MSNKSAKKTRRDELLGRLWDLGRVTSTQTVFLHQALAQQVGLNATDTKCLDLILRGPAGAVTAGWLSGATGLTTGAITHILDRLEKRRFIQRLRDKHDRRKVLIRARPGSLDGLVPRYERIGEAYLTLLAQYSDDQLQLICEYLEKTSALSQEMLQKLVAGRSPVAAKGSEKARD
jgi:DNA-binding MarR family transcriptional regulator